MEEGEYAAGIERQLRRKRNEVSYVISMDSKMAPIPMLMFSAVMYLVCRSGSGEALRTEKAKTHIFHKADHGEDSKSRGLPERQEH